MQAVCKLGEDAMHILHDEPKQDDQPSLLQHGQLRAHKERRASRHCRNESCATLAYIMQAPWHVLGS